MSISVMTQVWKESATSGSERLILLALADNANDKCECWPSMATLAKHCNISRRYVIELIEKLRARGYIRSVHRINDDGKFTSNLYRIQTDKFIVNPASPSSESEITNIVNPASPSSEPQITNIVNPASQNPPINHQLTIIDPARAEQPDRYIAMVAMVTGLMPSANDLLTIVGWEKVGVLECDLRDALQWRKENGKPPIKTISHLAGGVEMARLKRIQGENAKPNGKNKKPEKHYDYDELKVKAQELGL